ncbi:hypothetical protein BAY1663_03012 [Pseudomonas sp. BAY1663]|uniref:Uncharacterized protein n=1 Tax=Stutzerimonas stutzeri TaxID=316 RepID=A0A2N8T6Z9_STUST|nr:MULTISPECIES: hypothetical protein [Pseudomonadaceae]EXF44543.1 hypothetical protein BAY1663_03012 [Pseudomonas sp. BAY1663]MCQ4323555.1 hypothetical protein [Stutzerimonas stutzeri]PNG10534.1 hypothetical protein CXK94_04795 [Stutzerimonas stutzeri]
MDTKRKTLATAVALAGLLGAGAALADGPMRLTEPQMDQMVAGALVSESTTYEYFHGYSNNPASEASNGTSTYATTTQVWCPGASVTCATPAQTTMVGDPVLIDGPGNSFP